MHSRATIAALVLAMSACAGSNEENRPAQAVGESHNYPQTTAGAQQQQQQQRPPMAMQGSEQNDPSQMQNQDQSQPMQGQTQGQTNQSPYDNSQMGQGQVPSQDTQPGSEQKAETIGDAQIVALAAAAHKGEIEEGKLAQTKAKDASVKKFATMMVTDHTQAMERTSRLAQRANIKPADTDKSRQMEQDAKQRLDQLKNMNGAEFDKQYMDNAVKEHTEVLLLIDSKMLPNVKNTELKTLLEGDKTKVSKHLAEAREIQRRLTPPVTQR